MFRSGRRCGNEVENDYDGGGDMQGDEGMGGGGGMSGVGMQGD